MIQKDELLGVLKTIKQNFDFEHDFSWITGGGIDSFGLLSIVTEIEDKLKVEFTPEEIVPTNFDSLDALYKLIKNKCDNNK